MSEQKEIGTILAGRYELRAIIVLGALSTVYLGYDLTSCRDVVVKWARPRGQNERDRLVRESRLQTMLMQHSTGVAQHLDFIPDQEDVCLITEYIRGEILQAWQSHEGRTQNEILAVYQRLARVLHEFHQAGVAHRDLKPSNVMLADGESPCRVVLLGFGRAVVAAEEDDLVDVGPLVGDPRYMSPETLRGEATTAASDIFVLGVMLCEALVGRPPWSLLTAQQFFSSLLIAPPELGHLTGTSLGRLITATLAREPEARPSAVQVMHTLAGLQELPRASRRP